MYEVGIIGGMGPDSSRELLSRIIMYTDAKSDQEHVPICLLNIPDIPDRTAALLKGGASPVPALNAAIRDLIKLGAKRYIICCNTAHYFAPELIKSEKIAFIDMVSETVGYIKEKRIKEIAVLGTEGVKTGGVYSRALANAGIAEIDVSPVQNEVSAIIYGIKGGGELAGYARRLDKVIEAISKTTAGVPFLLGCTELSLLSKYARDKIAIIDPLDITAKKAIQYAGYKIKPVE
ncbi:MAG: amino acid racemase [Bacillota bacterium]|mgnify:FL=1|jgi:aspartate racemase|nr:amino acid racemase [Bacillota bacterium]NLM32018.1 amino acid racemase [Acholeplasmataceae bacterium]